VRKLIFVLHKKVLLHYFSKVIVLKTEKKVHTNCGIVWLKLRISFLYRNETVYSNLFEGNMECLSNNKITILLLLVGPL